MWKCELLHCEQGNNPLWGNDQGNGPAATLAEASSSLSASSSSSSLSECSIIISISKQHQHPPHSIKRVPLGGERKDIFARISFFFFLQEYYSCSAAPPLVGSVCNPLSPTLASCCSLHTTVSCSLSSFSSSLCSLSGRATSSWRRLLTQLVTSPLPLLHSPLQASHKALPLPISNGKLCPYLKQKLIVLSELWGLIRSWDNIFSVTWRSRSDVSHSLCLSGLANLNDVTLGSDDTFRRLGTWVTHDHLSSVIESNRLDWCDPSEWWYL